MKRLSLAIASGLFAVCCFSHAQASVQNAPHSATVRIVLVGDSTVALGGGWGASFCALLTPNVECINKARNGRSSKSYTTRAFGRMRWPSTRTTFSSSSAITTCPAKVPERETDPKTTYAANMRRYIAEAHGAGARPVIVTSLSRRTYKDGKLVQDLTAYANAAKRVAREENVPLIDLNADSVKLLQTMTQEQADKFDAEAHPDAAGNKGPDRTHLNSTGAAVFARIVADGPGKKLHGTRTRHQRRVGDKARNAATSVTRRS